MCRLQFVNANEDMQHRVDRRTGNARFGDGQDNAVVYVEQRCATHGACCLEVLVHELQAPYAAEMTARRQSSEWVSCVPADFTLFVCMLGDGHALHELGICWQVE